MSTDQEFLEMVPIVTGAEQTPTVALAEAVAGGQAIMQTKTQYHTAVAVQKPRNLDQIVKKALTEADYAGEEFYYSWPVKDNKTGNTKIVEGATIGAAMAVMREWGNCVLEVEVDDQGAFIVFTPRLVDLETGSTFSRAFKYHPTSAPGRYDAERWADMQFQLAQSKAIRNVVVNAMPRWLIGQVVARAKKAELGKIDRVGLMEARSRAVDFYQRLGIGEERLLAHFGRVRDEWTAEDVALLRNMAKQYRDGEVDLDKTFPVVAPPVAPEPGQAQEKLAAAKGKGRAPHPDPANQQQLDAIRTVLERLDAPSRYQRDLVDIMAAIPVNITFDEAKALIEDLVAEPPVWTRMDKIVNAPGQAGQGQA